MSEPVRVVVATPLSEELAGLIERREPRVQLARTKPPTCGRRGG